MSNNTPIYDDMTNPQSEREAIINAAQIDGYEVVPNVSIENPNTRRTLTKIIGTVGAVLGAVIVADMASMAFDVSAYTDPAAAVFLFVGTYYGIKVTLPNTPVRK